MTTANCVTLILVGGLLIDGLCMWVARARHRMVVVEWERRRLCGRWVMILCVSGLIWAQRTGTADVLIAIALVAASGVWMVAWAGLGYQHDLVAEAVALWGLRAPGGWVTVGVPYAGRVARHVVQGYHIPPDRAARVFVQLMAWGIETKEDDDDETGDEG